MGGGFGLFGGGLCCGCRCDDDDSSEETDKWSLLSLDEEEVGRCRLVYLFLRLRLLSGRRRERCWSRRFGGMFCGLVCGGKTE